jgi:hypothetical protein
VRNLTHNVDMDMEVILSVESNLQCGYGYGGVIECGSDLQFGYGY